MRPLKTQNALLNIKMLRSENGLLQRSVYMNIRNLPTLADMQLETASAVLIFRMCRFTF